MKLLREDVSVVRLVSFHECRALYISLAASPLAGQIPVLLSIRHRTSRGPHQDKQLLTTHVEARGQPMGSGALFHHEASGN